ncbi:MAG: lipopolysaccharide biosynthesis protein [Candidatus Babeliales bacterium]
MHIDALYGQISQAVRWNAFSYTVFKITSTILTFVLFKQLSTSDFALWTGINSLVYLILLWADMGMRKTIPTFLPQIKDSNRKTFIYIIIGLYFAVLNITCPLALAFVGSYAEQVHLPINSELLFASGLLYFGHGLEMLFQTIFHAYLWHRVYNMLLAVIQVSYMLMVMGAVYIWPSSADTVFYIVLGKGIASIICVLIGWLFLVKKLKNTHATGTSPISKKFMHQFLKHAGLMWLATICKSFSERNVTVPLVTYALGPLLGNIFKVAQEAALLFQRIVFRTIGTTDTSLFAYVKNESDIAKNDLSKVFSQLASKLAYLTLPLIGLIWFMQCQVSCCNTPNFGFQLFFIISMGLLVELLLSPYERILEVYAQYCELAYAYIFYLVCLGALFEMLLHNYISLIPFVITLYSIRLLSMGIMAYAVHRKYSIAYPLKKIIMLFICSMIVSYIFHLIAQYACGTALLTLLTSFFAI